MPKALRDALAELAGREDILLAHMAIQDAIEQYEARDNTDVPEMSFEELPPDEWIEGVEEFKDCTTDSLWELLGLAAKVLPLFNVDLDSDGLHDRWDRREDTWFADKANLVPLEPRWHQLVGILKMLKLAFEGKPIMLMDEVGVGKTMQVVGLIAMLAYYRDFWEKNQDYPGIFSE